MSSRGASDADLWLVAGVCLSAIVGVIVYAMVASDVSDDTVRLVGGVLGLFTGIATLIGVIAKGVEVGNRS